MEKTGSFGVNCSLKTWVAIGPEIVHQFPSITSVNIGAIIDYVDGPGGGKCFILSHISPPISDEMGRKFWYETRDEAEAAISDACLRWAIRVANKRDAGN